MPTSFVPDTYEYDSMQSDGNQVTFYRSNSTVGEPRFLLISRKRPVYDQRSQTYSVPEYTIRVYKGDVDSDGIPRRSKLLGELSFRLPVWSDSSDTDELFTDIAAIVASSEFKPSVVNLTLPTCCDTVEAP